jgi:hypothetical protein
LGQFVKAGLAVQPEIGNSMVSTESGIVTVTRAGQSSKVPPPGQGSSIAVPLFIFLMVEGRVTLVKA